MKGEVVVVNGDRWTIIDVAPAAPLAEMVAALLEDEGLVTMVRGSDLVGDVFSHMGTPSSGTTYVLVPEADAERALAIVAETVTDFEGDELDAIMRAIAEGADPEELFGSADDDEVDDEGPGGAGSDGRTEGS